MDTRVKPAYDDCLVWCVRAPRHWSSYPRRRVSSTPRPHGSITNVSEYWIARWSLSSGGHSADPLAGDDGCVFGGGAFSATTMSAITMVARLPAQPASPQPLVPSGLDLAGTGWSPTAIIGMSSARGSA